MKKIQIYVEGPTDKVVVRNLLQAADLNINLEITVCGGKQGVASTVSKLQNSNEIEHIALIDADELSVADSQAAAAEQLGFPEIKVFCAVPTIEAWLFADDQILSSHARSRHTLRLVQRLPLPEMIPYPKLLASNFFEKGKPASVYEFMRQIDIDRAIARCPSMKAFIRGIAEAAGKEFDYEERSLNSSIGRDAISTLLNELPREQIAWRTLEGGALNAGQLARAVAEGTPMGRQYSTELLRVARDLIARRARK